MRLLDLFCGAGGAAMGYYRAGFTEIVGVDITPQPRYPFSFRQMDALEYLALAWPIFDAIHASPPCEHYSQLTPRKHRGNHADLIGPTRRMLIATGRPFVIENVPSAKRLLRHPFMLCGTMFGLGVQRHRFFETNFPTSALVANCNHAEAPVLISGTHRRTYEPRYEYSVEQCRLAAGIPWMTRTGLDKAIPPAYTEYIGRQLIEAIQ